MSHTEPVLEIPAEVLSSPELLFLYYRIEQILGIKPTGEALVKLNENLEKCCGVSFIQNPAAFEKALTSREQIFDLSKNVTVNETYFFREGAHFDVLIRLLPQLIMQNRPIQICSAATSIGCEAYSIAMLLDYHAKNGPAFDFKIDAFDISDEAIETAKKAQYTANTLREDGADWKYIMDSYLIPDGSIYSVSENIRSKVNFFTHNIMRGLNRQYDVIFFRNALIYFSSKNRLIVINDLAESLFNNGLLFLGISETSAVKHPLLAGRNLSEVFFFQKIYYQKTLNPVFSEKEFPVVPKKQPDSYEKDRREHKKERREQKDRRNSPPCIRTESRVQSKHTELPIDCGIVKAILDKEEGETNAKRVMGILANGKKSSDGEITEFPSREELTASAAYFLAVQDFSSADLVLSQLEKNNAGAPVLFLRGEYHLLCGNVKEAENSFENAAGKDRAFWPALYRIASLAAEGNQTRYEYRITKASESLELGRELHYECFMGGFSPDYFERVLNRKVLKK